MTQVLMMDSPVEAEPRPRVHLGYLDGLRALAALCVVLSHAWLQVWPVDYQRLPTGWIWRLTGGLLYSHFAVDLFIVLSGFCLMLPVVRGDGTLRGGALLFFRKRARRILPPYYFAMLFSLLLIWLCVGHKTGTHWDISVPVTRRGLLTHVLLLQDLFGNSQINHAFWSVAVEWKIYFLFPALVWGWRRVGGFATTGVATVIPYGLHFLFPKSMGFSWLGPCPWYVSLFAFGMLGAGIAFSQETRYTALRQRLPWGWIGAVGAVLTGGVCAYWGWQRVFAHFAILDFAAGLAFLSLLVSTTCFPKNWLRPVLEWKPIVFLGTFAYSIYLIHAPLLQVVWQYWVHPMHLSPFVTFLGLSLVGLPAIIGISYVFFCVCERPFLGTRLRSAARQAVLSSVP